MKFHDNSSGGIYSVSYGQIDRHMEKPIIAFCNYFADASKNCVWFCVPN